MDLRISLLQTDIIWEDKAANLLRIESVVASLKGQTDLLILPEMFTTGFSMNSRTLAESTDGNTIKLLKRWVRECDLAITGSFISQDAGAFYNRGFFLTPDGKEYYYDKRHLFRMGTEGENFSFGTKRLIVPYKSWNISLLICYDLRFPVWSRNVDNEYDLLIYVASWPESRKMVWNALLPARALENMCYVAGVNRVGTDGEDNAYSGNSVLISPKGIPLLTTEEYKESVYTAILSKEELDTFRERFPAWKDADHFMITG